MLCSSQGSSSSMDGSTGENLFDLSSPEPGVRSCFTDVSSGLGNTERDFENKDLEIFSSNSSLPSCAVSEVGSGGSVCSDDEDCIKRIQNLSVCENVELFEESMPRRSIGDTFARFIIGEASKESLLQGVRSDTGSRKIVCLEDATPKCSYRAMRKRKQLQNITNVSFLASGPSSMNRATPALKRRKKFCGGKKGSPHILFTKDSSAPNNVTEMKLPTPGRLPGLLEVDYSLQVVKNPQITSAAFQSINGEEIRRLMAMLKEQFSEKYVLVDCRYPFEYCGGHIKTALNMYDVSQLETVFFPKSHEDFEIVTSKIPIFYCEFSQKRGPRAAHALRQKDRDRNVGKYPEVTYREIYLLDRGYKGFYEDGRFLDLCEPSGYTPMAATPHRNSLRRYEKRYGCRGRKTTRIGLAAKREAVRPKNKFRLAHRFSVESPSCFASGFNSRMPKRTSLTPQLTRLRRVSFASTPGKQLLNCTPV